MLLGAKGIATRNDRMLLATSSWHRDSNGAFLRGCFACDERLVLPWREIRRARDRSNHPVESEHRAALAQASKTSNRGAERRMRVPNIHLFGT